MQAERKEVSTSETYRLKYSVVRKSDLLENEEVEKQPASL